MASAVSARGAGARLSRTCGAAALPGVLTLCALLAAGAPAAAFQEHYNYRVVDQLYGSIGTYRNTVERDDDATTITTEAHIGVSVLGITLYRQDVSRVERREGDRLVYFHGITTENGNPVEVDGRAEGNAFVVSSPHGKVSAPATIRPVDPWSAALALGDTALMPDTGLVTKIHTSGGEETSITIDGAAMQVKRYRIETVDGSERYEVWMGADATPVKFNIQDQESNVTFTLVK